MDAFLVVLEAREVHEFPLNKGTGLVRHPRFLFGGPRRMV